MEKQLISLLIGTKGQTIDVQAHVYGKLAVHFTAGLSIGVSHIKSGCSVGEFGDWNDASDFAQKADKLMDFDEYTNSIISIGLDKTIELYQGQYQAVRQLRATYSSYDAWGEGNRGVPSKKLLKNRMATS